MIPPSTKDIMQIASSKYAVVVAVANRLSTMVTEALEEISQGKISVELLPDATLKEA